MDKCLSPHHQISVSSSVAYGHFKPNLKPACNPDLCNLEKIISVSLNHIQCEVQGHSQGFQIFPESDLTYIFLFQREFFFFVPPEH